MGSTLGQGEHVCPLLEGDAIGSSHPRAEGECRHLGFAPPMMDLAPIRAQGLDRDIHRRSSSAAGVRASFEGPDPISPTSARAWPSALSRLDAHAVVSKPLATRESERDDGMRVQARACSAHFRKGIATTLTPGFRESSLCCNAVLGRPRRHHHGKSGCDRALGSAVVKASFGRASLGRSVRMFAHGGGMIKSGARSSHCKSLCVAVASAHNLFHVAPTLD